MQPTSNLYRDLLAELHAGKRNVRFESRLAIGDSGTLIDKGGNHITFGGERILVDTGGPDAGYGEDMLIRDAMVIDLNVFPDSAPAVGQCIAGQIDVELMLPVSEIPIKARLVPYVRLTDGVRESEWIQQGVFYIDDRKLNPRRTFTTITLHGFDAMLKAQADYPATTVLSWPARDIDVVREIARAMDVPLDARTVAGLDMGYLVEYPAQYSQQEVLGYIAAMYAGCFVISPLGELLLIRICDLPPETNHLVDAAGNAITFGGVRILV